MALQGREGFQTPGSHHSAAVYIDSGAVSHRWPRSDTLWLSAGVCGLAIEVSSSPQIAPGEAIKTKIETDKMATQGDGGQGTGRMGGDGGFNEDSNL